MHERPRPRDGDRELAGCGWMDDPAPSGGPRRCRGTDSDTAVVEAVEAGFRLVGWGNTSMDRVWSSAPDDLRSGTSSCSRRSHRTSRLPPRLLPLLADDGAFVVFQNGLCESRIASIAGPGASSVVS